MNNIIKRTWNKNSLVNIEDLRGVTFQDEGDAHTFVISGIDGDGNPVTLSGTPSGTMLRPDNTDQTLTCSVSGGKVYATLPDECYDVPGRAGITIFLTSDNQTVAIYAAVVSVTRTQSGTAAPGTTADVVDLVNAINAAIAGIPATDTAIKAAMAPTYSNSSLYAVGSYAWYNGTLYRCTTAITTAETWTSGHWTAAALGNDLRDLKSALRGADGSDIGRLFIPCDDGIFQATNLLYKKVGNCLIMNGYGASTSQRLCIYGQFAYSSGSPTYANVPAWYHSPCDKIIVGHKYYFDFKLVSGVMDKGSVTTNIYYRLATQSGTIQDIVVGNVWEATFAPEMMCFVLHNYTYTNAIIELIIYDITEMTSNLVYQNIVSFKDDCVRTDIEQSFTEEEKEIGRNNLEAVRVKEFRDETARSMIYDNDFFPGEYAPYREKEASGINYIVSPGMIKLNGTGTSGRICNLLGSQALFAGQSTPESSMLEQGPFYVEVGHTYKITSKQIAGTSIANNAVIFAVWNADGSQLTSGNLSAEIVFVAETSTIGTFTFYAKKSVAYDNVVIAYKFSDITEELTRRETDLSIVAPTLEGVEDSVEYGQLMRKDDELYRNTYLDANEPSEFVGAHWTKTTIAETYKKENKLRINNISAFNGGVCHIPFEQGSAAFSGDIILPSNTSKRVRTPFSMMPYVLTGDIISIASGYEALINVYAKYIDTGVTFDSSKNTSWITGNYFVPNDGLMFMFVQKTDQSGTITPEEAEQAVTITHAGVKFPDQNSGKHNKKNPYRSIPWDYVHDITSVSHAHLSRNTEQYPTRFEEGFAALQTKYDHIALSMYYPSAPVYPLENYFSNIGTTIGSPNGEHVRMIGESGHLHLCAIGSYLATNPDSSSPYVHVGTLQEVVSEAVTSMKNNGGGITINHPRWSGLTVDKIISIMQMSDRVIALEVWNASCEDDGEKGDSSELWDGVLSRGYQIFATAVPDHEAQYHYLEDRHPFGYNHLLVVNRTEDEILTAYRNGRFYTTLYNDGLLLKNVDLSTSGLLTIEVSEASTYLFKTATRSVEVSTAATTATFQTQNDDVYVRVEAYRGTNKLWTNAIMLI